MMTEMIVSSKLLNEEMKDSLVSSSTLFENGRHGKCFHNNNGVIDVVKK